MRFLTAVLALTVAASLAAPAGAQDRKPPTFGVQVEMVNLTVAVVDGKGKYVDDLPCEAFSITESGARQKVELCERQELPIDLVLLMDASASMKTLAPAVKEAAIKVIRTLRPQDRATIMLFGDRVRTIQDLTGDQAALEAAVTKVEFSDGVTRLYMNLYVTLRELERSAKPNERRKVIILLTDGEDTGSSLTDDQIIAEASRHTAVVYPILIRPAKTSDADWQRDQRARYFAGQIALMTGGKAHVVNDPFAMKNAYDLIAEELKLQYRLGYYPTHAKDPGPKRTISVLIARENVHARHRSGYFASKVRTP